MTELDVSKIKLLPRVVECVQCGEPFVIGSGEREFFLAQKINEPRRCQDCRRFNREKKAQMQKTTAVGTIATTNQQGGESR